MKKKHAMEWVEALRSGKYKQGISILHDTSDDSYCVLGVLNDLHKGKLAKSSFLLRINNGILKDSSGHIPTLGTSLMSLNDGGYYLYQDFTFDELADIIQICYKEL